MKRIWSLLCAAFLLYTFSFAAFAESQTPPNEKPWLMAMQYKIENGYANAGEKTEIAVTYQNKSETQAVRNIKLSVTADGEAIQTLDFGTKYVKKIEAKKSYTWKFEVEVAHTARPTSYPLQITAEYEDENGCAYSASDTMQIPIRQTVMLDYENAVLPVKMEQNTTSTIEIKLMNTGKTDLSNCKVQSDITGLSMGGSVYVGEILAGQAVTVPLNFRVIAENLGNISGTIEISFEDAYGKTQSIKAAVQTEIIEKQKEETVEEEEETTKMSKRNAILVFFLGLTLGGLIGSLIPIAIIKHKQRLEDEKRL